MTLPKFSKVVIWGHRPIRSIGFGRFKRVSHTHSYIHAGYARAFEFLGYETLWVNSLSDLGSTSLSNALIFTEGQVDHNLPTHGPAAFVTHHSDPAKYESIKASWLKLNNFVADVQNGISFSYPGSTTVKIDDVTYIDEANNALYMPWATDLLPGEQPPVGIKSQSTIHYVGTVNHDGILPVFRSFQMAAKLAGFKVRVHTGVSDQVARQLALASHVVVDIRGDWHRERGYIPCRIWKSLSYGRALTSNSEKLQSIFGDRVAFAPSEGLFPAALHHERQVNEADLLANQDWVMQNHTFVNRANRLLQALVDAT